MKKGTPYINRESVKNTLRQALTPTFLLILLGSFLLWYASKLSNNYTTEMPLNIYIDGQKYRVTAIVHGRGSTLVAQRLSLKSKLSFTMEELSIRASRENKGAFVINPTSLQRAINGKNTELQVMQIVDAPDFVPAPEPEPESVPAEE